ncbi:hypothetical protein Hte_002344 [Hypoxylon texense]
MPSRKTITVFGATGAQGGGVVSTFLSDPGLNNTWKVRAITRDPFKESAKRLAEQGAEVIAADLNDKDSLIKAIKGSYAVFGVTNYWEKADADLEVQQGMNLADAVKGTLPNVYHFDSKAKVEDYIRTLGLPATFFMPGFYMTGIPGEMFKAQPPNNAWTFALPAAPTAVIPVFHPRDTGKYIKAIVLNAEELLGERFPAATAYMRADEIVDGFVRAFPTAGATAQFFQVPEGMFRGLMKTQGLPDYAITELYENVKLLEEFGYFGGLSLARTHSLVQDSLTTWNEYLVEAPAFKDLE